MAISATRQESTFHTLRLDNGIQMLGQKIPGVESAASIFWVCTGSRDETPPVIGVSHFLEHMAFRRTQHMTGQEIDHAFEEMGAESNAATSKEMTFYWARVLGENVERAVEVLAELTHPALDADDFDQERRVILEEIARYQDQPPHVLLDMFFRDYFGTHPLHWEVLGTTESIENMKVEQMREYWGNRYGTRNLIFSIAGNFDWETIVRKVSSLSSDWQAGTTGRTLQPPSFSPGLHVHVREKFVQEQMGIAVPSVSSKDPRYWAASLLATILGDDTGSRLFWSLYQEGLADPATAQTMEFDDTGLLFLHIVTQPENTIRALEVARSELRRLQEFDVEESELERAKAKLTTSVIIGGESTNERVFGLINSWLTQGRLETLEETRRKIDAVTLDDLRSLLRDLPVWPELSITAVGPLREEDLTAAG